MTDDNFPVTSSGKDLDSYCNEIDMMLADVRDELEEVDLRKIPSSIQREGFLFMRKLLNWAESFTGTLRYDVGADHTDCPEHDEWMQRKLDMARKEFAPVVSLDAGDDRGIEMVRVLTSAGRTMWVEPSDPVLHGNAIYRSRHDECLYAVERVADHRFRRR